MRTNPQDQSEAFAEVYTTQFSSIYNYVYAQILNREETEDLVSEIFLKALSAFGRFDPEKASVRTWLTRIARNTLIDHYRTRREIVPLDTEGIPEPSYTDTYDVFQDPINREVRNIFLKLTPSERELLSMIYFREMKNPEIGEVLGISPKAVSERHRRLLAKCRNIEKGKDLSALLR